ncbi:MAG: hypothetical protein IPO53_02035 [Chitinophagaceae bacterium]|nr:hypothetical protein [Chitinophagaceae bacterium]
MTKIKSLTFLILLKTRRKCITWSAKRPDKLKELQNALKDWEKKNAVPPLWPSAADVLIEVNGKWFRFPS